MAGIDRALVDQIDFQKANQRIKSDINSDFIFAPHLKFIYTYAYDFLSSKLTQELRSGTFNFNLPQLIDVPKASGLTRPGAILLPKDRLLYQALSDNMIDEVEKNLDREHVFSNIPSNDNEMFVSISECYKPFEYKIQEKCSQYQYCLKTDIASFFETIYQHFLISQLHSTNIQKGYINILEKALLAWRENKSYGILQGMYPSDLFGNYYLSQIDYYLKLANFDFVRFVDDIYIFSNSEYDLKKIIITICKDLRQQGLFLNENKTLLAESKTICDQLLEFDQLFFDINNMFTMLQYEEKRALYMLGYGFQIDWESEAESAVDIIDGFRIDVVEELYKHKDTAKYQKDAILKFCLPLLTKFKSVLPLLSIKDDISKSPHLAKHFAQYLATIERGNESITQTLEGILFQNNFIFEYEQMWLFAGLLYRSELSEGILKLCATYFMNKQVHDSIRAICAIILSSKGSGHDKKLLRDEYNNEPSIFVKSAILFSTSYWMTDERQACKIAWGSNNYLNELIIEVLKKV